MNIVAIDVSKMKLDVYIDSNLKHLSFTNDLIGVKELIKVSPKDAVFVFEATGGYENELLLSLVKLNRVFFRCSGLRIRKFASSQGKAKTDKIDAEMIAKYAKASDLKPFNLADKGLLELRELNIRRLQAMSMMQKEANRLEHKLPLAIKNLIKQKARSYEKEIVLLDKMIIEVIDRNEEIANKIDLIKSVPGVGLQTAITILSEIPELGTLDKNSIAAMTGLAPFNKDSGTLQGKRRVSYSRQRVKAILYMVAMSGLRCNDKIKSFYKKLKKKGKPGKLALTACMRKLIVIINAMIANKTYWSYA